MPARMAAVAAVASVTLTGCSLIPTPSPDPTLLSLYQRAALDAKDASDPNVAALRADNAAALKSEIERLCGHYDDGQVPESCQVTEDPTGVDTATPATTHILDQLATVPQESLPVVLMEFLQLATQLGPLPPLHHADVSIQTNTNVPKSVVNADEETFLLRTEQEFGFTYGLQMAMAYADADLLPLLEESLNSHYEILNKLEETTGSQYMAIPVLQPTYDLSTYPTVSDAASAREFYSALLSDLLKGWMQAAAQAGADSWRYQSFIIAGLLTQEAVRAGIPVDFSLSTEAAETSGTLNTTEPSSNTEASGTPPQTVSRSTGSTPEESAPETAANSSASGDVASVDPAATDESGADTEGATDASDVVSPEAIAPAAS